MRSLWGVGPAGPIHFGYDTAARAQLDLVEAGFEHTILFADLHVMLSHGLPFQEARSRAAYYESVFSAGYGIDARFVRGSDFELASEYVTMLFGASGKTPLNRAVETLAGEKADRSRTVASVLYSLMQCLDAIYLGSDVVLADQGQRKIYRLIEDGKLMDVGRNAPIDFREPRDGGAKEIEYRYYPLMVDIQGNPLNRSTAQTRILIHEPVDSLRAKVNKMYAPPAGQPLVEGRQNALLCYLEHSALPWVDLPVTVPTRDGAIVFDSIAQVKDDYDQGLVHPSDLKAFLCDVLAERVRGFRNRLATVTYGWINPALGLVGEQGSKAKAAT